MAEAKTVGEMREHLVSKASADTEFRAQLLSDPKGAIKAELGLSIPAGFTINVHEEAPDASHLVLPPAAELGEAELQQAAGGGGNDSDELFTIWDDF